MNKELKCKICGSQSLRYSLKRNIIYCLKCGWQIDRNEFYKEIGEKNENL